MSAPNTSSSSSQLVSYTQDVNYTRTEGFKQFKAWYNVKNARAARNVPNGVYPSAETIYQAVKGPGCTLRSFDSLLLDDFITSGSMAARRHLKRLSLVPYYVAQMKRCTQKWDRRDNQGPNSGTINTCRQLISIVGTSLYHLMADIQSTVGRTVDPYTGGRPPLTRQVHGDFMVSSETKCPTQTRRVHEGHFYN